MEDQFKWKIAPEEMEFCYICQKGMTQILLDETFNFQLYLEFRHVQVQCKKIMYLCIYMYNVKKYVLVHNLFTLFEILVLSAYEGHVFL
jgi:hypothetical protein